MCQPSKIEAKWMDYDCSIHSFGVNSADSTEFTGPVEYPIIERRSQKKVIVCRTGLSTTWSLAMPLTRRHALHHQGTRIYRKICGCRLLRMENNSSLRRGSVTTITKRFSVACCTVHRLWKRVVHTHSTGIINSLAFNSWKKFWGATNRETHVL